MTKYLLLTILGISLAGCTAFGSKKSYVPEKSPCACQELVNHANV
jgi:hypothetical protein